MCQTLRSPMTKLTNAADSISAGRQHSWSRASISRSGAAFGSAWWIKRKLKRRHGVILLAPLVDWRLPPLVLHFRGELHRLAHALHHMQIKAVLGRSTGNKVVCRLVVLKGNLHHLHRREMIRQPRLPPLRLPSDRVPYDVSLVRIALRFGPFVVHVLPKRAAARSPRW